MEDAIWLLWSGIEWVTTTAYEVTGVGSEPVPSSMPTPLPTITCDGLLLTVTLSDSYGDGWAGNKLYVVESTVTHVFTLSSGSFLSSQLCLSETTLVKDYTEKTDGSAYAIACGGSYVSEISWTVGDFITSGGTSRARCPELPVVPTSLPTPSPTPSPSITSSPTPSPLIVIAESEEDVASNLASYTDIEVAVDLALSTAITIQSGQVRLHINGNGWTISKSDSRRRMLEGPEDFAASTSRSSERRKLKQVFDDDDGGEGGGCFIVEAHADLTVTNMTVRGGSGYFYASGGGFYINGGSVTLNFVSVVGNEATTMGGGVYVGNGGVLIMNYCTVKQNILAGNNTLENNAGTSSIRGAGIFVEASTLEMNFCDVSLNSGAGYGGGIHARKLSKVTLVRSTVSMNNATAGGGGICVASGSTLHMFYSNVTANTASVMGGGLYLDDSTVNIATSDITYNTVTYETDEDDDDMPYYYYVVDDADDDGSDDGSVTSGGGGMYIASSVATLEECRVASNKCTIDGHGGGMIVLSSTLELVSTEVFSNTALDGGGFYLDYGNFYAISLTMNGNVPTAFSGDGTSTAQCVSPCARGNYATCLVASGAPKCFLGCSCALCPAGKASNLSKATSNACESW